MADLISATYGELNAKIRNRFAAAIANVAYAPVTGGLVEEFTAGDKTEYFDVPIEEAMWRKMKGNIELEPPRAKVISMDCEEWTMAQEVRLRDLRGRFGDKYELFAEMRGRSLGPWLDNQVATAMKSTGAMFTQNLYDAQPYFSANHEITSSGGTYSNLKSDGGGDYWYLFDTRVIKPFLQPWFQRPEISDLGPDSEHATKTKKVIWTYYMDVGLAPTLWQFGYASNATLNEANLDAAALAMKRVPRFGQSGNDKELLGVRPDTLVVGGGNALAAMKLMKALTIEGSSNGAPDNINRGRYNLIEIPHLT